MRDSSSDTADQADRDLARRGRYGSLVYVAAWLIVLSAYPPHAMLTPAAVGGTAALLGLGLTRLVLGQGFERMHAVHPVHWRRGYAATVVALGLTWGMLLAYTLWAHHLEWASYLCLVATAGIVCGGVLAHLTHLKLLRAYVLCILLPGAASSLAMGTLEGSALAGLLLLATGALLVLGEHLNREYRDAMDRAAQLERHARDMELAAQRAVAADQATRRYLANTSHEIRTPLNGLLGMIDLLKQCRDPVQREDYLATMERAARAMLKLTDDVLDLSKIEAQRLTLERTAFRPAELATDVQRLFLDAAGRKDLDLRIRCGESAAQPLMGDPHRLRQVLNNLVSNAVKFTEQGQVVVQIDVLRESDGAAAMRFEVQDSGIGIPSHATERIFDAFEQADPSTTGSYRGTGLGLTISRQLVELMGGELVVHSTPGEGSRFSFELTFEKPVSAGAPASVPGAGKAFADLGLRVLVAEDNRVNRVVTERFLAVLGCRCLLVESGREALKAFAAGEFDAVLMDCEMPDMDGYEATVKIRKLERVLGAPPTPIIAVTAHVLGHAREAALGAGMSDFLSKPFTLDQLARVLRSNTPGRGSDAPRRAGILGLGTGR